MKILLIGFTKIKYMPYMNYYLDRLDKKNNDIHIVYWNRDLKEETEYYDKNITYHDFCSYQEDDVNKILKIKNFIKFKIYTINKIKKEQFDFIIVMHTLPAILISKYLIKNYSERYILDYRDFTYENFYFFKMQVAKLVKYSKYTFVSSDKYRTYLPEKYRKKTITSHNILGESLSFDIKKFPKTINKKIRISFWGFIREEELNKTIINKISNDNRFELHFYGREQQIAENLKKYTKKIGSKNVFFHGEYKPIDRNTFSQHTDLIHNIYNSKNSLMSMGNKYYDGLIFKIPQLCMKDSFMGEKCTKNKLGLEVNPYDETFNDDIYKYYKSLNKEDFYNNCNQELNTILNEIKKSDSILKEINN